VKNSLVCPIMEVSIQNSGSTDQLVVGTGYVVTGTTANEMPIIDIAITPNNIPCFSSDYFAKGSTSPYSLINENEGGCSKYGLDSYFSTKIDSQKQDLLFSQNSFPSSVLNLPGYAKIYDNTNAVLSSRRRMDVLENDACLNIETEKLKKAGEAAIDMNKMITGPLICCLILHGFILLVMSFALNDIIFKKKKASQVIYGVCSDPWMTLTMILGFLEYIGLMVLFCFVVKDWNKMYGAKKVVTKLEEKECLTTGQAETVFADYQELMKTVANVLFALCLLLFLVSSLTVVPSIVLLRDRIVAGVKDMVRKIRRIKIRRLRSWCSQRCGGRKK